MALLFFEGFEAYSGSATTGAAQAVQSGNWASAGRIHTSARTGARSLGDANGGTTRTFTENPATGYIGFGYLRGNVGSARSGDLLRVVGDVSGNVATLRVSGNGDTLHLDDGAGAELYSHYIAAEVWHFIELGITLGTTDGSLELRINGASVFTATNIDTGHGSNTGIAKLSFNPFGGSSGYTSVDDIYFCDGSGTANNTFLGPVRVHALAPDSDVETGWAPDTGTTHYTQVDDQTGGHDSDTTYVFSDTVGARDLYGMADLPTEYQNPLAVQPFWSARHDDSSGGAGVAGLLKSGVTEVEGTEEALAAGYVVHGDAIQATNPDTGLAWTVAEINALQVGAIVKSNL